LDRTDVFKGALLALAHSAALLEVAANLYAEGQDTASFVTAIWAREEVGRFALLARRGRAMGPSESVSPTVLRKTLDDHVAKLRAGQTSYPVPMRQDWIDEWRRAIEQGDSMALDILRPQLESAQRAIRRREPLDTHQRRLRSQYVDPQPDGSWSGPDSITEDDVRVAVMGTAAGIANALIGLQSDHELRAVVANTSLTLVTLGEFTTRVFGRIALRGA
jgi:AbiV family abortive infection protein